MKQLVLIATLVASLAACAAAPREEVRGRLVIRPGLEVVQVPIGELGAASDSGLLTLFYFDPDFFRLRLLTAAVQDGARPADRWLEDFDLIAVINASMYLPNQRSTGFMVDHEEANNPAINPRFGGFLGFGAADSLAVAWEFAGEDCDGFALEDLRRRFPVVVQNYRLLDCDGRPFGWADQRSYSSAAIGRDRRGWLVFAHSGAACLTADFAAWLSRPEFGLTDAHFVEGGPEASLMLRVDGHEIRAVGAWPQVRPSVFRPIPNVLGVVAREQDR